MDEHATRTFSIEARRKRKKEEEEEEEENAREIDMNKHEKEETEGRNAEKRDLLVDHRFSMLARSLASLSVFLCCISSARVLSFCHCSM